MGIVIPFFSFAGFGRDRRAVATSRGEFQRRAGSCGLPEFPRNEIQVALQLSKRTIRHREVSEIISAREATVALGDVRVNGKLRSASVWRDSTQCRAGPRKYLDQEREVDRLLPREEITVVSDGSSHDSYWAGASGPRHHSNVPIPFPFPFPLPTSVFAVPFSPFPPLQLRDRIPIASPRFSR